MISLTLKSLKYKRNICEFCLYVLFFFVVLPASFTMVRSHLCCRGINSPSLLFKFIASGFYDFESNSYQKGLLVLCILFSYQLVSLMAHPIVDFEFWTFLLLFSKFTPTHSPRQSFEGNPSELVASYVLVPLASSAIILTVVLFFRCKASAR